MLKSVFNLVFSECDHKVSDIYTQAVKYISNILKVSLIF